MRYFAVALALSLAVAPMAVEAKKAPSLTPLQLQALQSREFETSKDNLFAAVMTVVQDLGYQVQSADLQTGFITATSASQNKTSFFEALGGVSSSGNTKVTVFIVTLPNGRARVRFNFLNTKISSSSLGQNFQEDKPILDAKVYVNAWDKIDEALFVMGAFEASTPKSDAEVPTTNAVAGSAPMANPANSSNPPSAPAEKP